MPLLRDLLAKAERQTGLLTGDRPDLVPIGVPKFDKTIQMDPGTGGVLAADTGVGKSTLALVLLLERKRMGLSTVYVSTEDPLSVVYTRIVALTADVSATSIRMGTLTGEEKKRAIQCSEELRDDDKIVLEFPNAVAEDVEHSVRRGVSHGCSLAIVDYLQAVGGSGFSSERERINEVFRISKEAAGAEGGALMMVSQFRRIPREQRNYTRHDIKGSGDIANAARLILIAEHAHETTDTVYLRVEKSTVGGEGMVQTYRRRRESGMLTPLRTPERNF